MLADVARANDMTLKTLGDAVALMQDKALCIAPLVPEAGAYFVFQPQSVGIFQPVW